MLINQIGDFIITDNKEDKILCDFENIDIMKIETVGVACIATLGDKVEENLLNDNINIVSLTNYKSILNSALEEKIINAKEYESMKLIYEEK